jgi:hypothetical protein
MAPGDVGKRRRILALVAIVAAGTFAGPGPRSAASPYTESFVTMISQRGDWIGLGDSRHFHDGNGSVGARWNQGTVYVHASGGPYDEEWMLEFSTGDTKEMTTGDYDGRRPRVAIAGEGRGCNVETGRFLVKDIALGRRGRVVRLWLLFQHSCEGTNPPMIGEVRYRMPGDGGDLLVGPRAIRWPTLPIGGVAAPVPVRVVNTAQAPVSVASVSIDGPGEMQVRLDECTGRTLASSESCAVWVRFEPSVEGSRTARLHVTESGGIVHTTELEGEVRGTAEASPTPGRPGATVGGGTTVFSYQSDRGEYIGQGQTRSYDPSNADISATGNHHGVSGMIFTDDGENWHADFSPPAGDILAPGLTFDDARRAAFAVGPAGLDVSGAGRGCNEIEGSFSVHALRTDDFGNLVEFSASFEQHCEGLDPALRGVFRYRHPGPLPSPPPYPPPPAEPKTKRYERFVKLVIEDRTARGRVTTHDLVPRCVGGVTVKLQRRSEGRFRTVHKVETDESGRYEVRVGKRHGRYRAVAPPKRLRGGDVCARARSRTWRF